MKALPYDSVSSCFIFFMSFFPSFIVYGLCFERLDHMREKNKFNTRKGEGKKDTWNVSPFFFLSLLLASCFLLCALSLSHKQTNKQDRFHHQRYKRTIKISALFSRLKK
ncbi:hypothetical protein QBC43DRAFT_31542 [Cladorrhinum sp. PSN259]|nr:hypothetical protein QBC43DRAFT_31542 [Cladorrhinum sp. PSN259]